MRSWRRCTGMAVTGPMRAIMAGAAFGSSAVCPKSFWPLRHLEQVGAELADLGQQARPVRRPRGRARPRWPRRRWRCRERRAPPAAGGSAGRHWRPGAGPRAPELFGARSSATRVSVWLTAGCRSLRRSRRRARAAYRPRSCRRASRPGVGAAPARSRSWVITTMVAPSALSSSSRERMAPPGAAVEIPRGLVGQDDGGRADECAGDSDPLALATRTAGWAWHRCGARARPGPAPRGRRGAARPGGSARVEQPVGHVLERASRARPGRTAGRRSRSACARSAASWRSESCETSSR